MKVIKRQFPGAIEPVIATGIKRQTGLLLTKRKVAILCVTLLIFANVCAYAAAVSSVETNEPWLGPYTGPTRSDIDPTTLDGKVLCGYQGWFNTPCDTECFGFGHWGQGLEGTNGRLVVDMWPDVSEYDPGDLCEVPGLKMPDGCIRITNPV
jgi:hypothetical protein